MDLVLLDLGLPDSFGIDTVRGMHEAAPDLPIVVLTALSDEEVAIEAVREGAQDYLDKSQLNGRMLGRVIRYAFERTRAEAARSARPTNDSNLPPPPLMRSSTTGTCRPGRSFAARA